MIDSNKAAKQGISKEELQAREAAAIPLGRYGTPEEFAKLTVWLCSPVNSYVSGQNILVDGAAIPAY